MCNIKFICCDYSGENKSFHDSFQANGHNIKFEFSGPSTAQHNGKTERKFQIIYGSIRVTLNNGGLEHSSRSGVLAVSWNTKIQEVISPDQDLELIYPELQSRYYSVIWMIYLTKYSRPNIRNSATIGTYLEMLRIIKVFCPQHRELVPQNSTGIRK
jgi:hypothetical protein